LFVFLFLLLSHPPPCSPLFPYTTLFRSCSTSRSASYDAIARFETMWHSFFHRVSWSAMLRGRHCGGVAAGLPWKRVRLVRRAQQDRKSTRLNSSHVSISYAVFCLKKKTK